MTNVKVGNSTFTAPEHWFWNQFNSSWEPETRVFFKKNLIKGSNYLDIGAWVGPTAMIATDLGAGKVKIVEPNPVNFMLLTQTQLSNNLLSKWWLINACVSDRRGSTRIGPLKGINSGSSATNIREEHKDGAEVISLKLEDILTEEYSLVKIDIEGAEAFIVKDLRLLEDSNTAIWLSIHVPHYSNRKQFLYDLRSLENAFYFTDEYNVQLTSSTISSRIMSNDPKPLWGTQQGNFFEIGLLPKKHFDGKGKRK